MKRLPFTRRRVACKCMSGDFVSGIVVGHFTEMVTYFSDRRWMRYYSVLITSGPASIRGCTQQCPASSVFRWPQVGAI